MGYMIMMFSQAPGQARQPKDGVVRSGAVVELLLDRPAAKQHLLKLEVELAPGGARDRLLRDEAGGREHAQAAVRKLLLLHDAELGGVLRREAERVEAKVARGVAVLERLHVVHRLVRVGPALLDAQRLADANAKRHREPQHRRQLGDLLDRGTAVRREERVEVLLDEEAGGGEHANAAVGELGLAPPEHLRLRLAIQQVGRVKLAGRGDGTGEAVAELLLGRGVAGGGGHLDDALGGRRNRRDE
mmetsp:Transcript_30096/g.74160  ORF Transcript_30096/g.74160 Transcript_30096/m.74160 type:complete len:245 (-) Transcript_30096:80-814(-)